MAFSMQLLSSPDSRRDGADHREAGFTLVELLVVLAILGLIVALVTPQVLKYLGRAKTDTARIEIQNIGNALDLFRLDLGRYPTQQEGLEALIEQPTVERVACGFYAEAGKKRVAVEFAGLHQKHEAEAPRIVEHHARLFAATAR